MARKAKTVRVGIIRCDTHGYWYSPLFEAPDPEIYRKHHRCCHYYFYSCDDPHKLRFRPIPNMKIVNLYDEANPQRAACLSEAYGGRPRVCSSCEEVSEGVDLVYVADCDFEGKDHLRYATPGLKKGVPHFVDKPFAYTLADARKMIALAVRHKTAVMCSSLLRRSPYLDRFRVRTGDIAPVGRLSVRSGSQSLASVFHALSLVQQVMGGGCEWVESMGPAPHGVIRLHYPGADGGTDALILNAEGVIPGHRMCSSTYHHCRYTVSAYGDKGTITSPGVDDYLFLESGVRIVRMAREMALTKKPPIPYASMLELMEMIEAARLSNRKARRVALKELR